MPTVPYLVRRGHIFRFRTRVPNDLTAIVHRREISRSLATSDPLIARRRLLAACVQWDEIVDLMRNDCTLTADRIDGLIDKFIRADIRTFEALQRCAKREPELEAALKREAASRPHYATVKAEPNAYPRVASLVKGGVASAKVLIRAS